MKKETNMRTFVKAIVVIGVMAMVAAPASAWTITVTSAAATATGFTTYTFSVSGITAGKEISSIEGDFNADSGDELRQHHPFALISTFEDANGAMAGDGGWGDSDSQFEYHAVNDGLIVTSGQIDTTARLWAAFTGPEETTTFNVAHVVLDTTTGGASWNIKLVERLLDNSEPVESTQSGHFGIPEPATMLVLLGGAVLGIVRRRRR